MADPVLFKLPHIKDSGLPPVMYRAVENMVRRIGGEGTDLVAEAVNAAEGAAVDNVASTILDGTYGTPSRVARITIAEVDGVKKITAVSQQDITYPVTTVAGQTGATLPVQTGWPAPSTLTVSDPPTQAEMQAIESRQRSIITSLRACGLFDD
jgi:hypothetical protein